MSAPNGNKGFFLAAPVFIALLAVAPVAFAADDYSTMKDGFGNKPMTGKTDNAGKDESMSNYLGDAAITAKVKAALVENSNLESSGIHVTTTQGVVTLTGTAESQTQIDMAKSTAQKVEGVKSVVSNLMVHKGEGSDTPAPGY